MKNRMLILCTLAMAMTHALAAPSLLSQIQAEMRARQFDKAAALAGQAIAAKDAADEALFLKATACLTGIRAMTVSPLPCSSVMLWIV